MEEKRNQSQSDEYDEETCVTARELRLDWGLEIPDNIPDCAWVPRWAIRSELLGCSGDEETGTMEAEIGITFAVPFKWVEVKVTLDNPVSEEVLKDG